MKALVKKCPINARYESENEVWEEARWTAMMKESGNLEPYINEDYGYALCEDVPDDMEELTVDNFEITEHTKTVPSEMGDGEAQTVRYWTAKYVGNPSE